MLADVFFIRANINDGFTVISEKARRLFKKGGFSAYFKAGDFTAVKVHVGEEKNTTYIKAPCIKGLIDELMALNVKAFLTDTSTLYTGRRHNAIDHAILASEHGFDIAGLGIPFIVSDGLFGTSETAVKIDGQLNKEVMIAYDITRCQSLLSIAHFTGHVATCAAATLKTLGMGCASRKGKMRQHSALKPKVSKNCTRCGVCIQHCPADAITLDDVKAHIDQDKCIGCAECVAMCRFEAVAYDWGAENVKLQKDVAEHALGVLKGKEKRSVFFNFVLSVTHDCDCYGNKDMDSIVGDIGIFASTDPVAVDSAAVDAVEKTSGKSIAQLLANKKLDHRTQLEHAEKIGLGSRTYRIIEIK
ncbi:MAG: DUF362 domain-containing protein [Phycisphaerae bacterium]|jgi:hypothetical protein